MDVIIHGNPDGYKKIRVSSKRDGKEKEREENK